MSDAKNGKYDAVPGKIPGTPINLGGVDFVIAPLNLDGVQAALPLLEKYGKENTTPEAAIRDAAAIVILAVNRNNPDCTVDDLVGLLDFGNVEQALMTVVNVSGLKLSKPGESTAPGR